MKNAKKWALTGLVLFVIGLVLAGAAFVRADFDFENLMSQIIIEKTYKPEGEFDKIVINIVNADVIFAHAEDGKTRVEIHEIEKIPHFVQITDGTLEITSRDTREWLDRIGFFGSKTSVKVYLPKDSYESAFVMTLTGHISIPSGFSFQNLDACTSTGKLSVSGVSSENINLTGTTGRIILTDIDVQNELTAHMTTGDISIKNLKAQKMTASTTTGDVMMNNVLIQDLMSVKATTGDISFRETDAGEIHMKCTTGDIEGSFLTEKKFTAKATTGHVSVPNTQSGGLCTVTTTTGHIQITIGG